MTKKIYACYDVKSERWTIPFFSESNGSAIRIMERIVNEPGGQHDFTRFPADFTLFFIGEYDELSGELFQPQAKVPLGTLVEFKQGPSLVPSSSNGSLDGLLDNEAEEVSA